MDYTKIELNQIETVVLTCLHTVKPEEKGTPYCLGYTDGRYDMAQRVLEILEVKGEKLGFGYSLAKLMVCAEIVIKQCETKDAADELLECRKVVKDWWHDELLRRSE